MTPCIDLKRIWSDDDILELTCVVSDGESAFVNSAHVGVDWPEEAATALTTFSSQVHGGIYDLKAGLQGPEYAKGALLARFHYHRPTALFVSTFQQSDFFEFKGSQVASEARLFLRTEPVLIDRFIPALRALQREDGAQAVLECLARL